MQSPLSSTGKPPHFFFVCDKATVNRKTNQCVLLGLTHEGARVSIPVGAPLVYTTDEKEDGRYALAGGTATELADSVVDEIINKLDLPESPFIPHRLVLLFFVLRCIPSN